MYLVTVELYSPIGRLIRQAMADFQWSVTVTKGRYVVVLASNNRKMGAIGHLKGRCREIQERDGVEGAELDSFLRRLNPTTTQSVLFFNDGDYIKIAGSRSPTEFDWLMAKSGEDAFTRIVARSFARYERDASELARS